MSFTAPFNKLDPCARVERADDNGATQRDMTLNASLSPPPSAPRTIVQLVPTATGGVRDYVDCLRNRWRDAGLANDVIALSEQDAREQALVDRLRGVMQRHGQAHGLSLLLHYSGYGYDKRGLCFWLVRELENARTQLAKHLKLVTMFHELSASGPPWGSAFWLSGAQSWIASRIALASDRLMTNSEHHARWLRDRLRNKKPIQVWPVFSTVGEPASVAPAGERELQLVVFGSESTRRRALARLSRYANLMRRHGVHRLVEVGSGKPALSQCTDLEGRFDGRLDAPELRSLLERSAFALLDYPSIALGKSTVFAAYAVHGCVALNTAPAGPDADRLIQGLHFLTLDLQESLPMAVVERQVLSDAGRAWYSRHGLVRQAASIAEYCRATDGPETIHA